MTSVMQSIRTAHPSVKFKPRAKTTKGLIVHASHTVPGKTNMVEWLRATGRVYGLLDIGYHFVIFENGELIETRPHATQGSHAGIRYNRTHIGVCLIGGLRYRPGEDGEQIEHHCDTFTIEQKAKLKELWSYLKEIYGQDLELKGHTELQGFTLRHGSKPCPPMDMETFRNGS